MYTYIRIHMRFHFFVNRRPIVVCVCSCFPDTPIAIDTRVIILQHPNEVHVVMRDKKEEASKVK